MSRGRPTEPCRSGKEEDCGEAGRYPHAHKGDAMEPQVELGQGGTTSNRLMPARLACGKTERATPPREAETQSPGRRDLDSRCRWFALV